VANQVRIFLVYKGLIVVATTPMNARKGYSAITTYKLGKSDYLAFIFFAICDNNTRLLVSFISLCFGLYLSLIVSRPHISPYKRPIRVYFSKNNAIIRYVGLHNSDL
jgi:hypothetical protein